MRTRILITVLILVPALSQAQSALRTRHPIGLFQDMKADTVTSDLFNHFAPTPHLSFHVTRPVPDHDLTGINLGLAVLDFNGDGIDDILKADRSYPGQDPSRLLLGRGDGTFEIFDAGLPPGLGNPLIADLDHDGWDDLACRVFTGGHFWEAWSQKHPPTMGESWPAVFRNVDGKRFEDMTDAWLGGKNPKLARLVMSDVDLDGWIDLVGIKMAPLGKGEILIFSGKAGKFSPRPAIPLPDDWNFFNGAQPLYPRFQAWDVDDDGDEDLLMQDPFHFPLEERLLMAGLNDGEGHFTWESTPLPSIARLTPLSWVDVNNDGRFDAYAGTSDFLGGRNQLYLNQGPWPEPGSFEDRGREMGLWAGYNNSHGGCWADLDNDGFQDFFQCRDFSESGYTDPAIFLNDGGQRFLNCTARADAPLGPGVPSAVALDADQDGDLDLFFGHKSHFSENTPLSATGMKMLRNDSRTGHWLRVKLVGTRSNRSALGARAEVFIEERQLHQAVANGRFWGNHHPGLKMHFGLGTATAVDSVVVRWPGGVQEVFPGYKADQEVVLKEGEGQTRSGK